MSNFLKEIIKETGNEYAALVSDGVDSVSKKNCEGRAFVVLFGMFRYSDLLTRFMLISVCV